MITFPAVPAGHAHGRGADLHLRAQGPLVRQGPHPSGGAAACCAQKESRAGVLVLGGCNRWLCVPLEFLSSRCMACCHPILHATPLPTLLHPCPPSRLQRADLTKLFPDANPLAVDLLGRMLQVCRAAGWKWLQQIAAPVVLADSCFTAAMGLCQLPCRSSRAHRQSQPAALLVTHHCSLTLGGASAWRRRWRTPGWRSCTMRQRSPRHLVRHCAAAAELVVLPWRLSMMLRLLLLSLPRHLLQLGGVSVCSRLCVGC